MCMGRGFREIAPVPVAVFVDHKSKDGVCCHRVIDKLAVTEGNKFIAHQLSLVMETTSW